MVIILEHDGEDVAADHSSRAGEVRVDMADRRTRQGRLPGWFEDRHFQPPQRKR